MYREMVMGWCRIVYDPKRSTKDKKEALGYLLEVAGDEEGYYLLEEWYAI